MSMIDTVRKEMMQAMKEKNTPRKDALSLLLSALKAKAKDKREDLTQEEETTIVLKELKQTKETLETAPANRTDIIEESKFRISVLEEFAPKMLSEDEIKAEIEKILSDLGIESPTAKEKGPIMKAMKPLIASGKADGGLINKVLQQMMQ